MKVIIDTPYELKLDPPKLYRLCCVAAPNSGQECWPVTWAPEENAKSWLLCSAPACAVGHVMSQLSRSRSFSSFAASLADELCQQRGKSTSLVSILSLRMLLHTTQSLRLPIILKAVSQMSIYVAGIMLFKSQAFGNKTK